MKKPGKVAPLKKIPPKKGIKSKILKIPPKRGDITLFQKRIPSPIGPLLALASKDGLCYLSFQGGKSKNEKTEALLLFKAFLKKYYPTSKISYESNPILEETEEWLKKYFKKEFNKLRAPSLDLKGSLFARQTLQTLQKVKPGKTKNYSGLAAEIGRPLASRAVGRVLNQNPIALIIPCHRIIGKNGDLTGFRGGLDCKAWLLRHESNS